MKANDVMSYVDPTSAIDRAWLLNTARGAGKCVRLANGHFRLPPARLGFAHLVEPKKFEAKKPGEKTRFAFGTDFVFPHELTAEDFGPINEEIDRIGLDKCGPSWPTNPKLFKPFKEQSEKLSTTTGVRFSGYNPIGLYISCSAGADKPPVLQDTSGRVIPDKAKFRSGNWVLPIVSVYHLNQDQKKGVTIGLEGAIFLGEDKPFGVEQIDPQQAKAGLENLAAPPPIVGNLLED